MLAEHGIMDYSILLGIENKFNISDDAGNEQSQSGRKQSVKSRQKVEELMRFKRHMFQSPDGNQLFYFSIIDFL